MQEIKTVIFQFTIANFNQQRIWSQCIQYIIFFWINFSRNFMRYTSDKTHVNIQHLYNLLFQWNKSTDDSNLSTIKTKILLLFIKDVLDYSFYFFIFNTRFIVYSIFLLLATIFMVSQCILFFLISFKHTSKQKCAVQIRQFRYVFMVNVLRIKIHAWFIVIIRSNLP